jgi:hypothetical protein
LWVVTRNNAERGENEQLQERYGVTPVGALERCVSPLD